MIVQYDPRTALVVVDVQHDFGDPSGSLYVRGGEQVVPYVNEQVRAAREAGAFVAYTQDWHPPVTPHFADHGGIWPVHCVQGTPGAELLPDLVVDGPVVRKGSGGEDGYSGFSVRDPLSGDTRATELASWLAERGVERVVVVGLAGDYCVKETALDARRLGYDVVVPLEGTRFVELSPGDDDRAVAEMEAAGALVVR
ncbi:MAG: isochorismatase family protein [Actinomycetes bacterium]